MFLLFEEECLEKVSYAFPSFIWTGEVLASLSILLTCRFRRAVFEKLYLRHDKQGALIIPVSDFDDGTVNFEVMW